MSPPRSPDVLFIVADDLNTRIGCYGAEGAITPHLDALARKGVLFTRAYCQYPRCNPSRASLLSGLRPDRTGVLSNRTDWREHLRKRQLLPEVFAAAGYETVRVGKILHKVSQGVPWDDSNRWDRVHDVANRKFRLPLTRPARKGLAIQGTPLAWGSTGENEALDHDAMVADAALAELMRNREKPLLLALSFTSTHYPLAAPSRFRMPFDPSSATLSDTPSGDLEDTPHLNQPDDPFLTENEKRQIIASYDACVHFLDAQLGRVLAGLEDLENREVIIVFLSDHGLHLGEHFQWRKKSLFEEAARVPLLLVAPGVASAGQACTRVVELIDIFPTLAELCGLTAPADLDGRSLVPLLRNPTSGGKGRAMTGQHLEEVGLRGRSVRTERWRYTRWGEDGGEELYDHHSDPREFRNLASNPELLAVKEELASLLDRDG